MGVAPAANVPHPQEGSQSSEWFNTDLNIHGNDDIVQDHFEAAKFRMYVKCTCMFTCAVFMCVCRVRVYVACACDKHVVCMWRACDKHVIQFSEQHTLCS